MDRAAFKNFATMFHEPLLLVSAAGEVLYANGAAGALSGARGEELVGRPLTELVGDEPEVVAQQLEQFSRTRQAIPGSLLWRQGAVFRPVRCEGAVLIPRRDGMPAEVALRLQPRREALAQFSALNERIGMLSHEVQERRRIERSLRESQEWLRFTQSCAQAGSWEWDIQSGRLVWSEEFYRLCGLDPAVAEPKANWALVTHPDDRERIARESRRALEGGGQLSIEFRVHHPARGERWISALGRTVSGEDGRPLRMAGIAIDITARKRAEIAGRFLADAGAELSSSLDYEATLRKVAAMVVPRLADWCSVDIQEPDGPVRRLAVTHVDQEKVRLAHEVAARWPTDMDAARGLGAVLRSGDPEIAPEITDEILVESASSEEHLAMLRSLGLRSYICVPLSAHRRVLGAITFVSAESGRRYNEDDLRIAMELASRAATAIENARLYAAAQAEIADRRRAEEQLARQSEVTRAVTHNAASCLIMIDEAGRPTYMNPAAEAATGFTLKELAGRPLQQSIQSVRVDGESIGQQASPLADAIGSMVAVQGIEDVFLRKDGRFFPASCSVAPILQSCQRLGAVLEFRDVTEERLAQEELRRHAEDLARSNAELQEFAYITSHDMKEPLRGISTYSSFLLEDYGDVLEEDGREKLRTLVRLSKRMYALLDALMVHGRLARVALKIEECDLGQVAAEVVASMQKLIRSEGAEVSIGALPVVRCDRELASQLIEHLLRNAVCFNTSACKRVEILQAGARDGEVPGRTPVIAIRDNGIGIAPQHLAAVFRMFKRLHHRDQFGGGIGVGLPIAKRIVERHRGQIWAESGGGEGTTVCFTLAPGGPGPRGRCAGHIEQKPLHAPSREVDGSASGGPVGVLPPGPGTRSLQAS
jgi:PAS domain S-box-containing protein